VARVGSPAAVEEARGVLGDARRRLYRLLADDEATSPTASAAGTSDETEAPTA
jgi:hypothetical protein